MSMMEYSHSPSMKATMTTSLTGIEARSVAPPAEAGGGKGLEEEEEEEGGGGVEGGVVSMVEDC